MPASAWIGFIQVRLSLPAESSAHCQPDSGLQPVLTDRHPLSGRTTLCPWRWANGNLPGSRACGLRRPTAASQPFYIPSNQLLREHGFDEFAEAQCTRFYADRMGRPGMRTSCAIIERVTMNGLRSLVAVAVGIACLLAYVGAVIVLLCSSGFPRCTRRESTATVYAALLAFAAAASRVGGRTASLQRLERAWSWWYRWPSSRMLWWFTGLAELVGADRGDRDGRRALTANWCRVRRQCTQPAY